MRYIYTDLGCHDGNTIEQFRNWKSLAYDTDIQWQIYGFDPNPNFGDIWHKRSNSDIHYEAKAAWLHDGQVEYDLRSDHHAEGSTIMKEKEAWGMGEIIKVPCFDFSKWLKQFRDDHVILKMDIEGAELPILTRMIEDGIDDIPHLTMVEFHDGKMPKYDSNKHHILEKYRGKLVGWLW